MAPNDHCVIAIWHSRQSITQKRARTGKFWVHGRICESVNEIRAYLFTPVACLPEHFAEVTWPINEIAPPASVNATR